MFLFSVKWNNYTASLWITRPSQNRITTQLPICKNVLVMHYIQMVVIVLGPFVLHVTTRIFCQQFCLL